MEFELPEIPDIPLEFLSLARISEVEHKYEKVHSQHKRPQEEERRHRHSYDHGPNQFQHRHHHEGRRHRHSYDHSTNHCHSPGDRQGHRYCHCHHRYPSDCLASNPEFNSPPAYQKQDNLKMEKAVDQMESGKQGWKKNRITPFVKDPNAPKDKGYFVLSIIGIFGLVHNLPFMFLFTATEYWMYKFRDTNSNSTDPNDRTWLQTNFNAFHKISTTVPGVICHFIAAVAGHKIRAQTRLFSVLFVHSSVLILMTVFTQIDTDSWQVSFFAMTLGLQTLMACASALGGSGSMGLVSKLPPSYMKAYLMGQGGASLFSAILRLISIIVSPSTVGAALLYFVTGSVLIVITSLLFYAVVHTEYFRYYTQTSSKQEKIQKFRDVKDFKLIIRLTWPIILIMVFPMLFPVTSVTSLVVSENHEDESNVWAQKYFITVCTFLIPSLTGLIGRAIFNITDFDCSIRPLGIFIFVKDVAFGLLIFFSNAYPRKYTPVLIKRDWQYALIMASNNLLGDFLMNLNMIKSMNMVPRERIEMTVMVHMCIFSIVQAATSPLSVLIVNIL